jgi:hypothetical protein
MGEADYRNTIGNSPTSQVWSAASGSGQSESSGCGLTGVSIAAARSASALVFATNACRYVWVKDGLPFAR